MTPPSSSHPTAAPPHGKHAGHRLRPVEWVAVIHVGLLLLGAAWAFGGGATWARTLIAAWGSLGAFVLIAAIRGRLHRGEGVRQPLRWLVPWLGFNLLVLLSCLNPSFSEQTFSGQSLMAFSGPAHPALPSTANAHTSLEHLWLFDAIYLSAFNLLLTVRRRRVLRGLLGFAVGNAVILSVFGTFQKLGSDGLFFGLVPSPNARYFATFVYANHWAAFVVLMLAACVGLLMFYRRRNAEAQLAYSLLPLGVLGLLLMAITPLIAGSRAGTLLVMLLLATGAAQILLKLRRNRRAAGQSTAGPLLALLAFAVLAGGGAIVLGRATIRERWQDTSAQWRAGLLGERIALYDDTRRIASAQPAFGWGLGSFGQVLQLQRPRPLEDNRQYEHSYVDAHSDWLQSLAEVGSIGTLLLILCVAWPLLGSQALRHAGPLPAYLLGGCGLITLYAAVEFPFGNPAVAIAFWTCFFSAIQYVRLSSRSRTRG